MSNYLAIATVTAALRQIVLEEAQAVIGGGVDVTIGRPTNQGNGASVFLYQTVPNAAFRNADLPTRNPNGALQQRPQLALELHYLLSFWGDVTLHVPQRVMGAVMTRLHSQPVLQRAAIDALLADVNLASLAGSNLAEQAELVRIAPLQLSLEDLTKIWSTMLQIPYSVSAAYAASVVLLETDDEIAPGPPVLGRTVTAFPLRRPRIDRVVPAADPAGLVTAGVRVAAEGRSLRGEVTEVRIAGQAIAVIEARDRRVTFDLPPNLDAGAHPLLIDHPLMLGVPTARHRGVQSPVVPLIVHPRVRTNAAGDPDVAVAAAGAIRRLDIRVEPEIRDDQDVQLELLDDAGVVVQRVPAAPLGAPRSAVLRFDVEAAPGVYRLRVRVDWAESPLWIDTRPGSPTAGQLLPRFEP